MALPTYLQKRGRMEGQNDKKQRADIRLRGCYSIRLPSLDVFEDHAKDVKELMDAGVIDQLVGEDGKFYYVLTEFGKEITKQSPK